MPRKLTPLAEAAASESRLALLRQLRAELITSFESCECARDREPLGRRLQSLVAEIEQLADQQSTDSALDEVVSRRAARLKAAGLSPPARMDGRVHG